MSQFLSSLRVKLCPSKVSFCKLFLLTFSHYVYLFAMNVMLSVVLKTIVYQTRCLFLHILGEEGSKW